MAWRDTLRAARQTVHETFRVRAVYMLRANTVGTIVHVRLRQKPTLVQMQDGGPSVHEIDMALLFDQAEVAAPMVNAFVVVDATEAYRVAAVMPAYLGTVTATVVRLSSTEAAALLAAGAPEDF